MESEKKSPVNINLSYIICDHFWVYVKNTTIDILLCLLFSYHTIIIVFGVLGRLNQWIPRSNRKTKWLTLTQAYSPYEKCLLLLLSHFVPWVRVLMAHFSLLLISIFLFMTVLLSVCSSPFQLSFFSFLSFFQYGSALILPHAIKM